MAKHIEEEKDLDIGAIYTRSELFMEKNKTPVTIAVVAVLAIVAGLLGYRKFVSEPAAKQAAETIWKAQYYFEYLTRWTSPLAATVTTSALPRWPMNTEARPPASSPSST